MFARTSYLQAVNLLPAVSISFLQPWHAVCVVKIATEDLHFDLHFMWV